MRSYPKGGDKLSTPLQFRLQADLKKKTVSQMGCITDSLYAGVPLFDAYVQFSAKIALNAIS